MSGGFLPIRRGLLEHLRNGDIGMFEAGIFLIILLQADYRTGVWTGSAVRLIAEAPRGATVRKVQHALNRLRKMGFIRPFHRHGVRGNYRVLIDKFEITSGALKGMRVNAAESETWKHAKYEPCAVTDGVIDTVVDAVGETELVGVSAPYQERGKGRTKNRRERAARTRRAITDAVVEIRRTRNEADAVERPFLRELRQIVANIPDTHRHDPHSFSDDVCRGLHSLGWKVSREWLVENRGDGQSGFIDLVVTSPYRIAIELDRATPRQKSLFKLSQFDGGRVVILREQTGAKAVLDVTKSAAPAGQSDQNTPVSQPEAGQQAQTPGASDPLPEKQMFLAKLRELAGRKSVPQPMTDAEFEARRKEQEEQARQIRLAQPGPMNPLPTKPLNELLHEMGEREQIEASKRLLRVSRARRAEIAVAQKPRRRAARKGLKTHPHQRGKARARKQVILRRS